MTTSKLAISVATLALLCAAQARAHHSLAGEFDPKTTFDLTGTVTKVEWYNPHIWLYLDVKGEDGKVQPWQCEMGSPNQMIRNGWKKEDLPVGTVITAQANPSRDGTNTCSTRRVTFDADGRVMSAFGGK